MTNPPLPYPEVTHNNYRQDIDGLRGVAILLVVVYHAFPFWMKGGFIGVDIFFVISGYLISIIILNGLRDNSFSWLNFYSRRVRRIFPALITVFAACLVFGSVSLLQNEWISLIKHVSSGAGFVSNFLLWQESGYFDVASETKPLLHLWSLGIEEQFYLIWPLLLVLFWKRKSLPIIILVMLTSSFALNVHDVNSKAMATFYSPLTRFWELFSGSALAWYVVRRNNQLIQSSKINEFLSLSAVVSLVIGLVSINSKNAYPGTWALLPVLTALLFITAGDATWINRMFLRNKLIVWLGLISYPLYLWHWPLLSFARILGKEGVVVNIALIISAIVLAWLTYRFIEKPIRFGEKGNYKAAGLLALMMILASTYFVSKDTSQGEKILGIEKYDKSMNYKEQCFEHYDGKFSEVIRDRDFCHFNGDISYPYAFILGDSHASRIYHGIKSVDPKRSYVNMGRQTCLPFYDVEGFVPDVRSSLVCQSFMAEVLDIAIQSSAKRIYLTGYFNRYFDGEIYSDLDKLKYGVKKTFEKLAASGKDIVILLDVPVLPFSPVKCLNRPINIGDRFDCTFKKDIHNKVMDTYKSVFMTEVNKYNNIRVLDPTEIFCNNDVCRGMLNDELVYRDYNHLNSHGALIVANKLVALPDSN